MPWSIINFKMLSMLRFSTFHSIVNPIENEKKIDKQALPVSVSTPPSKVSLISLFKPKHFSRQRMCGCVNDSFMIFYLKPKKDMISGICLWRVWILVKPQTSLLELFSTYSILWIIEELYFMDLVDRIIMLKTLKGHVQ